MTHFENSHGMQRVNSKVQYLVKNDISSCFIFFFFYSFGSLKIDFKPVEQVHCLASLLENTVLKNHVLQKDFPSHKRDFTTIYCTH